MNVKYRGDMDGNGRRDMDVNGRRVARIVGDMDVNGRRVARIVGSPLGLAVAVRLHQVAPVNNPC